MTQKTIKKAPAKTANSGSPNTSQEASMVKKAIPKKVQKAKTPTRGKEIKTGTTRKAFTVKGGFAIIETGGKQYKVSPGEIIKIEKLSGVHKQGTKIIFDKVLLVNDGKNTKVGMPYLLGVKVEAVFEEEGRDKKISVIKFKSKSRYTRRGGHRQPYTKVKIL